MQLDSNQSTSNFAMAPFRVEAQLVGRVRGGKDLRAWYDRAAATEPSGEPTGEPTGEVWRTGDDCRAMGPYAGQTLSEIFSNAPRAIVAVPAPSAPFIVQNLGELDLIRITARWPGMAA